MGSDMPRRAVRRTQANSFALRLAKLRGIAHRPTGSVQTGLRSEQCELARLEG